MRWVLAGYALPAILISAFVFLVRSGPATAYSYNYALLLAVVLLLSASIAVVCLVVAVVLALKSLRYEPTSSKWPQYAVLLAAVVPAGAAALWMAQF
jgi:hypothetical protein